MSNFKNLQIEDIVVIAYQGDRSLGIVTAVAKEEIVVQDLFSSNIRTYNPENGSEVGSEHLTLVDKVYLLDPKEESTKKIILELQHKEKIRSIMRRINSYVQSNYDDIKEEVFEPLLTYWDI